MSSRHRAIVLCLLATSIFIGGCKSAPLPASDHFDGHRFHNRDRDSAPEPTFWEEARVAWALKTKHKNWPDRFESIPADAPTEPVLHGIRVMWR